jgi:maltooligosyltrehalose trehalohydrolase
LYGAVPTLLFSQASELLNSAAKLKARGEFIMATFRVWAPQREKVELLLNNQTLLMGRSDNGWWEIVVPEAEAGQAYQYRLDGSDVCPDPRSRYQPEGVQGASRLVDIESFRWNDHGFQSRPLSSAVIYELHVGTFTTAGTFEAAIERLDHLARLGVTHVELMPIAEFAGVRGWGYDGVFPFAPHHSYGGPKGLAKLVNACHLRGIGVLLDVVYNHLGPTGNCLEKFGPYFTDQHKTPWGSSLNFDGPYSDDVRQYFLDNARMWLKDYHIDGLRLDAVHAIIDTSAMPFLEQLAAEVKHLEAQIGKHLVLIAESDLNDPRIVRPQLHHGFGFHAQWNDDFHHALHAALTQEKDGYYCDYGGLDDLACVFERPYLYTGRFSPHRLRSHGRPAEGVHASSFIAYSQNHDQVGNRATGERLHQLLPVELAKVAAALTILSPYVPLLFQGEEWAASNPFQYFVDFSNDPKLASSVVEGRRKEFAGLQSVATVPDPQAAETFERSKLNWRELDEPFHCQMLQWYADLIALRRRLPALVDGRMERVHTSFDEDQRWLVVQRETTYLVANLGGETNELELFKSGSGNVELGSTTGIELRKNVLTMPAHSVVLITSNSLPIVELDSLKQIRH